MMKTPFYLGTRSLALFEAALRDVDKDQLRRLLEKGPPTRASLLSPRKRKLVEVELSRREASHAAASFVVIASFVGMMLAPGLMVYALA